MLNPQIMITTPPAQAARGDAATGTSNGQAGDTFGSVLARHMDDKKSAASAKSSGAQDSKTNNASQSADGQTIQDQPAAPVLDAASMTLASMLGNHGSKTSAANIKPQDKTPVTPTSDAATAVAGMFGNQGAALLVATEVSAGKIAGAGNKEITGIGADRNAFAKKGANAISAKDAGAGKDPATGKDLTKDTALTKEAGAGKNTGKTPGLTASPDKTGIAQGNPSVTASMKTETTLQSPLKTIFATELRTESSGALPGATPSVQTLADSGGISIASGASPDKAAAVATIATPLGSSAWPAEFAQKINWVSTQQNQTAELHLNPPDLGPMTVVLSISDNQASAVFSSPHSAVRDAIENAMPKLRESMADNGIVLGNATVNDQPPRDNGASGFMNQRENSRAKSETDITPTVSTSLPTSPASRHNGMVDTFA
jgi:flagellar hook-length control protein FliK